MTSLFDPPLQLPATDSLHTDEDARPWLTMVIGQLALLNIAYDLCEHSTPLSAYRILVNEILPTAKVHPGLAGGDIVQHYSAYEYCEQCQAEFDAEFEQYEVERKRCDSESTSTDNDQETESG